jgi:hypothetical protein
MTEIRIPSAKERHGFSRSDFILGELTAFLIAEMEAFFARFPDPLNPFSVCCARLPKSSE